MNEKAATEVRKVGNDNLALKQETMKMRKELQTLRLLLGPTNPILQGPGLFGPTSGKALQRPAAPHALEHTELQLALAAGHVPALPSEWEYKPPDDIPVHGGGGGLKAPPVTETPVPAQLDRSCLPGISSYTGPEGSHFVTRQPSSLNRMHIEGLEKQLMVRVERFFLSVFITFALVAFSALYINCFLTHTLFCGLRFSVITNGKKSS